MNESSGLLPLKAAAERWRTTPGAFRMLLLRGRIPSRFAHRVGRKVFIDVAALDEWLRQQPAYAEAGADE